MYMSHYFIPTLKETPADAQLASHRYMLRAGLIRRLTSGVYTWLPLGLRVLRRIEAIIRQEMASVGALELLMPIVQPAELWQETGRWDDYGLELLRFKDRQDHICCLGPTHEEVINDLLRDHISSYKQLPLTLFQIQTKFRDEIRPRFGVMRSREFIMKDAYSFHINQDSLTELYDAMFAAYRRIFTQLGLDFRAVQADSGAIGGSQSHEFQVLAQSGEDIIAYSDQSDYAANIEQADCISPSHSLVEEKDYKKLSSLDELTIPDNLPEKEFYKSIACEDHERVTVVLVKGAELPCVAMVLRADHELNPVKAEKLDAVAKPLVILNREEVKTIFSCEPDALGPNLDIQTYIDTDAAAMTQLVCGCSQDGKRWRNAVWGRDMNCAEVMNLRLVVEGDPSPDGKGTLHFKRGIEVGHIFQLGDKYSNSMQFKVQNKEGKPVAVLSGCYGIGVTRLVAAAIEQHHDQHGIIWPEAMAPFQVHMLPLMAHKSYRVKEVATEIYQTLKEMGVEVLFDDRKERPGVMFAQADLLGMPHRLVISEKGLDQQTIEYKARAKEDSETWPLADYNQLIRDRLAH